MTIKISEVRAVFESSMPHEYTECMANAMPVLLEIVEAALAWQDDPLELLNHKALLAALAKVTR